MRFRLKADATFDAVDYDEACEKIANFFAARSSGRYIGKDTFYRGSLSLNYAELEEEAEHELCKHGSGRSKERIT